MKILHLTLKKKWFDMIASGEKKEEYREIKPYWANRLLKFNNSKQTNEFWKNFLTSSCFNTENEKDKSEFDVTFERYDIVNFKLGYSKNAPNIKMNIKKITIDKPKPEWSENWPGEVFIIKLGKIINV